MSVAMQALFNYFKVVIHPGQAVLLFALRTIAAGLLTLYLAFLFDLDQPKWSIMAVVIVSQPLAGMALARSFGQVIGTTLGATVAVLIMAVFRRRRCRSLPRWLCGWRSVPRAARCCVTPVPRRLYSAVIPLW